MTQRKEGFISIYRAMILTEYGEGTANPWAADPARLEKFMASVRTTLFTQANTWNIDGPVVLRAWRALGLKGKPSYKGLRALAE